jgi:hypothetical protein
MASSRTETQVTWSAASSITLSSATQTDSDAFTISVEAYDFAIQVSADNSGTPASGDVLNVYLKKSSGDILGDSGDDFDTNEHAEFLCQLDTFSTNTPGEDPARRTIDGIPAAAGKYKLSVAAPNAASRNVVVRARIVEHKVA